ncbi:MAG: hypothetical protein M3410_16185 [Acidobacteriota bacterium]|nr:hypothetical protein [Acidobacteriota bacterium]
MCQRKVFLILVMFGVWTSAFAQSGNLLKNPSGDGGSEYWRTFDDAKVEQCPTGGRCFVLRGGGYFVQDVVIPGDAIGQYALLIGRAYSERTNTDGSITVLPSLSGYMMNSGDPSGGRIYAYLNEQQMTGSADSSNYWTQLWGVFRVKPGTGRIRFFLQQAGQKGIRNNGAVTRFDDLGLYIFPTEAEARAVVSQRPVGAQSTRAAGAGSDCQLPREGIPSLYGVKLGMSLEEVVSLFPASAGDANVRRALELSQSPDLAGPIRIVIAAHKATNQDLADVKQFFFQFRNRRLFSLHVDYLSPQGESVDEFIDQRGHLLNLPVANTWEPVEGNSLSSRYLICEGIEIRFYAAPAGSANLNSISLTDTSVEAILLSPPKLGQRAQP